MDFSIIDTYTRVSDRVEDTLPDCNEKKKFEKHIEAYFDKIVRCNSYWAILKEMKVKNDKFKNSYKYAPAFWHTIRYALQMALITDLVSFVSNDEASLKKYFDKMIECKNKIFTRKFFQIFRCESTGKLIEEEWKNQQTNDEIINICREKLQKSVNDIKILKTARDKVFCHYDKISLDLDKCNTEIFSNIKDKMVENILKDISYIIEVLYAIYSNIDKTPYDQNRNDVAIMLSALSDYNKNFADYAKWKLTKQN